MSPTLAPLLLFIILLLPLATAILLRLIWNRVSSQLLAVITALLFSLVVITVIALARSDIQTLQIAGVTLMSPARGLPMLPPELQTFVPTNTPGIANPTSPSVPEQASLVSVPTQTATSIATVETTNTATIQATQTFTARPTATTEATPTSTPRPTATATQAAAEQQRYTVEPGDTLRSIAAKFDVTVQAILDANNLTATQADNLRPGQVLIIP